MDQGFSHTTSKQGLHHIWLERPECFNALTFEMYAALRDHFYSLQEEESVRVIVIGGRGKAFCSGGDVEEIIAPLLDMEMKALLRFTRMTGALIRNIRQLRKPVLARLHGTTCGAGAVIALACDFRFASHDAKIAYLFTRVGLSGADMGAAYLLPRIIGFGRATELLMRGHFIQAEEAFRIGLYNQVVAADQLDALVEERAQELLAGPHFSFEMTKEMLNRELSMDLDSALEAEAQAQAICMQHPDFKAFYQSWKTKSPTVFEA